MLEEELDALLRTAIDFRLALCGRDEHAAVATLVHLDAIDINATTSQFPAEFDRIGGHGAFERGAAALGAVASVGGDSVRGLDLAA